MGGVEEKSSVFRGQTGVWARGSLDVLEVRSSLLMQSSPCNFTLGQCYPLGAALLCCPVEPRYAVGKDRRDRLGEKMQESLYWEGNSGCGWVHAGRGRFLNLLSHRPGSREGWSAGVQVPPLAGKRTGSA